MVGWTYGKKKQEKPARRTASTIKVDVTERDEAKKALQELRGKDRDELDKLAEEFGAVAYQYSRKGQTLRKRSELADPSRPSDAPINRNRKQVALTLPPDLLKEIRSKCDELGVNRNALIEYAVRKMLKPD